MKKYLVAIVLATFAVVVPISTASATPNTACVIARSNNVSWYEQHCAPIKPTVWVVAKGDTLWHIAVMVYSIGTEGPQ